MQIRARQARIGVRGFFQKFTSGVCATSSAQPRHFICLGRVWDHWPASQLWVLISSNLYTEQTLAHPSYAKNTLADFIGVEISAPDQAHRQNLDEPPKFIDDPSRLGEALIR